MKDDDDRGVGQRVDVELVDELATEVAPRVFHDTVLQMPHQQRHKQAAVVRGESSARTCRVAWAAWASAGRGRRGVDRALTLTSAVGRKQVQWSASDPIGTVASPPLSRNITQFGKPQLVCRVMGVVHQCRAVTAPSDGELGGRRDPAPPSLPQKRKKKRGSKGALHSQGSTAVPSISCR